jgi:hypothetical protein
LLRWEAEARVLLHQDDAAIRLLRQYLTAFPHERRPIAADRCFVGLHGQPAFLAITGPTATAPAR